MGSKRRLPPWYYRKDQMPSSWSLSNWRKIANELARKMGGRAACGLCKRPLKQWGLLSVKHPRSRGSRRNRRICTACANLMIHLIDVLEWFGASDNLPPEDFYEEGYEPPRTFDKLDATVVAEARAALDLVGDMRRRFGDERDAAS